MELVPLKSKKLTKYTQVIIFFPALETGIFQAGKLLDEYFANIWALGGTSLLLVIFCCWVGPVSYLELFWVGPVKKDNL